MSAPTPQASPPRPLLRGWSHAVATLVALALAPLLVTFSPGGRIVATLYAVAVVAVFGVSATYHCVLYHTPLRALMRRLDHSMIFVFIAATYTPFAVFVLEGATGWAILIAAWTGAIAGVCTRLAWPEAPRWLIALLYVLVGWLAIVVIDDTYRTLGVAGLTLLVVGGVVYTLGAAVYALQWPDPSPRWFGYHEVFHALVVAAVATHYVAIAFFALPRAVA